MKKISLSKVVCIVFMFCIATAISSPAQGFTTLYSFCSLPNCADGQYPRGVLVQGNDGNLYGTTWAGGPESGTVYKVTSKGVESVLYGLGRGSDGGEPYAGLIQGTDGNFYGVTEVGGGLSGCGTAFKVTPGGTYTVLHAFGGGNNNDGCNPWAPLVQGSDGNFYGTTTAGGTGHCGLAGCGAVFKMTPGGAVTILYSFTGQPDGCVPNAGLVQGTDGNFYGATSLCGANNYGMLYKITTSGTLTPLHSFNDDDGYLPYGGVIQGIDGNFYGTTTSGGPSNYGGRTEGTVFKISPQPPYTLTTLYLFCSQQNCTDGHGPYGGLVQGTDGNFYGTTYLGGAHNWGTVFEVTPSGTETVLYSFCPQGYPNCTDGRDPETPLIQANNGNLYGVTQNGGTNDQGTVFGLPGPSPIPVQFVPVTPCRLVDTRKVSGGSGPIQGGMFEFFNLPQAATQGKNCPTLSLSSAAAYSLNVTVVPQGPLGYLTVWPAGRNRSNVSTLNSGDGRVKANAAIIPAGASQAISVFASNTTDVVIDIDGYFAPASSQTLQFDTLPPCRVADTRKSSFPSGLGMPHLAGGVARDFPVLNATTCNIPNTAVAYSLNFTAVPYPSPGYPLGYLEVWPTGNAPAKPVSTLNNPKGTVVANAALVPAGTVGEITALASDNTDLVIDIDGYFAEPGGQNALSLYPVVPCRVLDTRKGNGLFIHELTVNVVGSPCAPPSTAQAYVFNATVVPPGSLGYLTLWPDCAGCNQPLVSTLNALDGAITSNMAIVPNSDGSTDAYASDLTQLILDISSYFAP